MSTKRHWWINFLYIYRINRAPRNRRDSLLFQNQNACLRVCHRRLMERGR